MGDLPAVEAWLEGRYGAFKDDVVAAIKAHPQYAQFVEQLAARGIQELFTVMSGG
jgi:hypothetical protein